MYYKYTGVYLDENPKQQLSTLLSEWASNRQQPKWFCDSAVNQWRRLSPNWMHSQKFRTLMWSIHFQELMVRNRTMEIMFVCSPDTISITNDSFQWLWSPLSWWCCCCTPSSRTSSGLGSSSALPPTRTCTPSWSSMWTWLWPCPAIVSRSF